MSCNNCILRILIRREGAVVVQMDGIQHKSLDKFPNCHFLLFKDNYQSFNLGGKLGGVILFWYWNSSFYCNGVIVMVVMLDSTVLFVIHAAGGLTRGKTLL